MDRLEQEKARNLKDLTSYKSLGMEANVQDLTFKVVQDEGYIAEDRAVLANLRDTAKTLYETLRAALEHLGGPGGHWQVTDGISLVHIKQYLDQIGLAKDWLPGLAPPSHTPVPSFALLSPGPQTELRPGGDANRPEPISKPSARPTRGHAQQPHDETRTADASAPSSSPPSSSVPSASSSVHQHAQVAPVPTLSQPPVVANGSIAAIGMNAGLGQATPAPSGELAPSGAKALPAAVAVGAGQSSAPKPSSSWANRVAKPAFVAHPAPATTTTSNGGGGEKKSLREIQAEELEGRLTEENLRLLEQGGSGPRDD